MSLDAGAHGGAVQREYEERQAEAAAVARESLAEIVAGRELSAEAAERLFDFVMDGLVQTELLCALLAALATRGETVDELVAAATALRKRMQRVRVPDGVHAIDTCGTGGDGKPTFNVSSAAAIVAASAGATVAKHGNRSHTRPSGSAEGLAALGVNVEADVPALERCLRACRIAFLYARNLHPAMKHAAGARAALGVRTLFNLAGPLANPAGVRRQMIGVSRPEQPGMIAEALRRLGSERAIVVYGRSGVCDLALDAPSHVAWLEGGEIRLEEVDARTLGLSPAPLSSIFVRTAAESAEVIRAVLRGQAGPAADTVILNAAGALWAAGVAEDLAEGVAIARSAIADGRAAACLEAWRAESHASG
jgi:anthranilate phosphoribosyltransferase